jgi:thiol-disulfide isomerase/thioredoxin
MKLLVLAAAAALATFATLGWMGYRLLAADRLPPSGVPAGLISSQQLPPEEGQAVADAIMTLTLPDLAGRPQAIAQWRGKVLVVNYWASWCAPCIEEMPAFSRLAGALRGAGGAVCRHRARRPGEDAGLRRPDTGGVPAAGRRSRRSRHSAASFPTPWSPCQRPVVRLRGARTDLQDGAGKVANELLYRHDEPRLELVEQGGRGASTATARSSAWSPRPSASASRTCSTRCWRCTPRSSTRCRTRSPRSTRRCCRASRCASCSRTTPAPARPSWPAC